MCIIAVMKHDHAKDGASGATLRKLRSKSRQDQKLPGMRMARPESCPTPRLYSFEENHTFFADVECRLNILHTYLQYILTLNKLHLPLFKEKNRNASMRTFSLREGGERLVNVSNSRNRSQAFLAPPDNYVVIRQILACVNICHY